METARDTETDTETAAEEILPAVRDRDAEDDTDTESGFVVERTREAAAETPAAIVLVMLLWTAAVDATTGESVLPTMTLLLVDVSRDAARDFPILLASETDDPTAMLRVTRNALVAVTAAEETTEAATVVLTARVTNTTVAPETLTVLATARATDTDVLATILTVCV